MFAIAFILVRMQRDCFKSRRRLEAEILVPRHQVNVLQQRAPTGASFSATLVNHECLLIEVYG